jgi:GDP-4-dehydro-6-deoxy-D-mannose reductase
VRRWLQTGVALSVGNLNTRRDYTDVRDVVRAYRLAVEAPTLAAGVLNVCSGQSVSGHDLLAKVANELAPGRAPDVAVDSAKLRPGDPEEIRGDNTAIRHALGWTPSIAMSATVRDVIGAT